MSLVSMREMTLGFGGLVLLDRAQLQIEEKERVCLLGRNGAGKSTLLKVVAGESTLDAGTVEYRQGIRVGMLPQEIPERVAGSVFDVAASGLPEGVDPLADVEVRQQVDAVLSRLLIDPAAEFSSLSGGTKRRALLARALSGDPDLLLLDEPTNHLDIDTIAWLEGFLLRRTKSLLFVSHDRAFADRVATRIVELDRGILRSWPGGYSDYLRRKQEVLEAEARANERFDKKLAEEEQWIRQGIRARRTRNEGRVRALEKMREERRARITSLGSVDFTETRAAASSKRVIETKHLSFSFPGKPIVTDLSTIIQRGDKVGLIGANGVGKSTLLRLLLGELEPDAGSVRHGSRVETAYLDQLRDDIDDEKTLIENLIDQGDTVEVGGKRRHIIGYLRDFLFSGDAARSPAGTLSGGERNRLLLAKLFTRPANVLVLDEPTNDLDIDTLELLESLLVAFDGTVLLVSHDRTFLNNVVTSSLVFEGTGRVVEYAGGYDDWQIQRKKGAEAPAKKRGPAKPKPKPDSVKKISFNERRELEALPGRIEAMEAELETLRDQMASPDFYQQESDAIKRAIARMEALEPELEEIYARWEYLEGLPS
jgi:ABC transport system ATP-binding/permease protein